MRILMLGNSLTSANDMPRTLAQLTGAEVIHHTRAARASEHLNPATRLGANAGGTVQGTLGLRGTSGDEPRAGQLLQKVSFPVWRSSAAKSETAEQFHCVRHLGLPERQC